MSWRQAIFTVFLGNVLVLVPMLLNAHAGAKYGIPFPVFARASFGVLGANVPAILRALVACGWFGINAWIGGEAINVMVCRSRSVMANVFAWCVDLLWRLLAAARRRDHAGDSNPQVSAGSHRAVSVVDRRGPSWRGPESRLADLAPMLAAPSKFQTFRRILSFFCAVADRRGGLLGHGGAEYSRFHALRAQPARTDGRPGPWDCRRR